MSFEGLHTTYSYFFNEVKWIRPFCDYVFFMSFDAEWYAYSGRNIVLSYQIATVSEEGTNNIIKYMEHGKRLTLAEIVEYGIRSVTSAEMFNKLRGLKVQVILISHSVAAEWSVLADRDESHITRRLSLVRGSPITDGHNIKITINDVIPIRVKIFDTILLAPAKFKSLKNLSKLIGSENDTKLDITQHYIENMNLYLQECPDDFERYALKDSEITLRLFFKIQESLNKLVGGEFKLYRTLASAGVRGFTGDSKWFEEYRKDLQVKYPKPYQLIKRSYYGGRNESYFIGRTNDYPETIGKIWIDIDFMGCYPTAMALSPEINLAKEADYIPRKYKKITEEIAAELVADNIPESEILKVREALEKSHEEFDKVMMNIKSKELSWKIRKKLSKYDNRLVDSWYKRWQKAKQDNDHSIEKVSLPGFARVWFKFPSNEQFPCLPIRHPEYGLLYVLEGETTVPAVEIMLAMEAGAEIGALTSVELPIRRIKGQPNRFVFEHLKRLANERNDYKAGGIKASPVMENLVKEFTNSFYGKFSQAINPSNVFRPSTGESVGLGESGITEPCTAALTTSLARTALSATLLAVERFNQGKDVLKQITIISATTDGLLIGVPNPKKINVADTYYENNPPKLKDGVKHQLSQILEECGCSELLEEINKFLPICQMRNSRYEMTGNDEILEIKHIADEIISIKTRGQIGKIAGKHTVLLARFNLKPPLSELVDDPEEYKRLMDVGGVEKNSKDAEWILGFLDNNEIATYPFITLNSFTKMSKSQGKLDLTKNIGERRINTDFDWKRKLHWVNEESELNDSSAKVSPFTVPHEKAAIMVLHRNMMESIRRTGIVARPSEVLHRLKVKGGTINARGGKPAAVTRLFVRGIVKGEIIAPSIIGLYGPSAEKINVVWEDNELTKAYPKKWTKDDFKYNNRKERKWEPGSILPNDMLKKLVRDLAEAFNADPDATEKAIFATEDFVKINAVLIEYVITAIGKAPGMGICLFLDLHNKGLLPGREKILDIFSGQMSEEQIRFCFDQPFIPGKLESFNAKSLEKIFYRLGISPAEAKKCARILAPPLQLIRKPRRNPGEQKCTDHFIQAILQDDLRNRELKVYDVLSNLKKYGVTRSRYYKIKSGKFNPNCIKNTPGNKQQISRMAKALGHDPAPLWDVLIEK